MDTNKISDEDPDFVVLKYGTLKEWRFYKSPEAARAHREYMQIGSAGTVLGQKDTPRQKELIIEMIKHVNGYIWEDFHCNHYTKEQAIFYIKNQKYPT